MSYMDPYNRNYVVPGFAFSTAVALYLWELIAAHGTSGLLLYAATFGCVLCAGALGWLATMVCYNVRMQWTVFPSLKPRNIGDFVMYGLAGTLAIAAAGWVFLHLAWMHAAVLSTFYITLVTFATVGTVGVYMISGIMRRL